MKILLIFFAVVATAVAKPAFDYCTMNCHINGTEVKHIACGNDNVFVANCPSGNEIFDIHSTGKYIITRTHNEIRNLVAGANISSYKYKPACRMGTVEWNDGLAKHAAFNLKQCKGAHLCHGTKEFPDSGQLVSELHITYPHTKIYRLLSEFVWRLFENIIDYDLFADMLTDRNIGVGCAGVTFPYKINGHVRKAFKFVCNYSTDIQDRKSMYAECESAGEYCKTGRNPEFSNLCSANEKYD